MLQSAALPILSLGGALPEISTAIAVEMPQSGQFADMLAQQQTAMPASLPVMSAPLPAIPKTAAAIIPGSALPISGKSLPASLPVALPGILLPSPTISSPMPGELRTEAAADPETSAVAPAPIAVPAHQVREQLAASRTAPKRERQISDAETAKAAPEDNEAEADLTAQQDQVQILPFPLAASPQTPPPLPQAASPVPASSQTAAPGAQSEQPPATPPAPLALPMARAQAVPGQIVRAAGKQAAITISAENLPPVPASDDGQPAASPGSKAVNDTPFHAALTLSSAPQSPSPAAIRLRASGVQHPGSPQGGEAVRPTSLAQSGSDMLPLAANGFTVPHQPLAEAAPLAATVPAEPRTDFATLVDQLVAAREAAMPHAVHASVNHAEFGAVSLSFGHDGSGLTVAMASADPDFARAVTAATPTERQGMTGDSANQQGSAQGSAAMQMQSGSNSNPQGQTSARQGEGDARQARAFVSPNSADSTASASPEQVSGQRRRGIFA